MRSFRTGKSRLSESLEPTERAYLARVWFEASLASADAADEILVLTSDVEVEALAVTRGHRVLRDPAQQLPLASLVDRAVAHLRSARDTAVLTIMADLPQIQADEVARFGAAAATVDVAAAPNAAGTGTNALWMNRGVRIRTAFGASDSLSRHEQRARIAGLTWSNIPIASAALDVDTAADLADWRDQGGAL